MLTIISFHLNPLMLNTDYSSLRFQIKKYLTSFSFVQMWLYNKINLFPESAVVQTVQVCDGEERVEPFSFISVLHLRSWTEGSDQKNERLNGLWWTLLKRWGGKLSHLRGTPAPQHWEGPVEVICGHFHPGNEALRKTQDKLERLYFSVWLGTLLSPPGRVGGEN